MSKDIPYGLYCPSCRLEASNIELLLRTHMHRIELPIFFCHSCCLVCVDRRTIRRILSKWRKDSLVIEKIPFEKLCGESLGELEEHMASHWIATLGYTRARFVKR
jgi:hypothetical protein